METNGPKGIEVRMARVVTRNCCVRRGSATPTSHYYVSGHRPPPLLCARLCGLCCATVVFLSRGCPASVGLSSPSSSICCCFSRFLSFVCSAVAGCERSLLGVARSGLRAGLCHSEPDRRGACLAPRDWFLAFDCTSLCVHGTVVHFRLARGCRRSQVRR